MKKNFQIAIDGPVAAGKGTVAAILARRLKALYIYTGGMYRALALLAVRKNIDLKDEVALLKLFKKARIGFSKPTGKNLLGDTLFLDKEDITKKIRTPEVSEKTPLVAAHPKIRALMVKKQQELAKDEIVVMEGRDIASTVLPRADLKIYLTADQKVRAKRWQKQLFEDFGIKKDFNKVLKEIQERDRHDSQRKASPLQITEDAWVLDTTDLSTNQVVEKIIKKLNKMKIL